MGKNSVQRTPQQLKLRRIIWMRIALILLLIGNGITLFTSIASSFYLISQEIGGNELDFFKQIRIFSETLTIVSVALSIAGGILLLLSLLKLGEGGSLKLKTHSKIAFMFLGISLVLNFAFHLVLDSLKLAGVLNSQVFDSHIESNMVFLFYQLNTTCPRL